MYMSLIRAWCVCPQKKIANGLSVITDYLKQKRIRIQITEVEGVDRSSYQLLSWMLYCGLGVHHFLFDDAFELGCFDDFHLSSVSVMML